MATPECGSCCTRSAEARGRHTDLLVCKGLDAPHDGVVGGLEYLISERHPGVCLSRAWPDLDVRGRARAIEQLLEALSALHATPAPLDLAEGTHLKTLATGVECEGLDVSPDGAEVWASNRRSDTLSCSRVRVRWRGPPSVRAGCALLMV